MQKKRREQIREELIKLKRLHARGFDEGKGSVELEPLRLEIKRLAACLNNLRGHEWYSKTPKAVKEHRQLAAAAVCESSTQSPQQQDELMPHPSLSQASSSAYTDETVSFKI
jgi:hypothetical protein